MQVRSEGNHPGGEEQAKRIQADREKRSVSMSSVGAAFFFTAMKIVTGSLGILSEAAHSGLHQKIPALSKVLVHLEPLS